MLVLAVVLVALAGVLGAWQVLARRAQASSSQPLSPVEQLLLEFLAPSVRAAGSLRNRLTPGPQYQTQPATAVGLARLRALEAENARLRALLALRDTQPAGAVAAEIIGREGYLLVGSGSADGVAPRMVALTPDGVLGQVVSVTPHTARILPLTDRDSGIGAITARTHATGVVKGTGGAICQLQYLDGGDDVHAGDQVLTSGLGAIFPRGLPLGTITAVTRDAALSTRTATLTPAVNPHMAEMVVLLQPPVSR